MPVPGVMFRDTWDSIKLSNWVAEGETAGPRVGDMAQAIAQLRPDKYTVESAATMLAALSKEDRATRAP